MATLRAAPTRHCHTEQSVEYLPTNTNLAHTSRGREGGMGKTKAQNGMQTAIYCNSTLQKTASKQLHIQVMRYPH